MGDSTMKAAAVSDTTWSEVTVRASAYVPSTARSEPKATADAAVPNTTWPTSSAMGQPNVYCEKKYPGPWPLSQGQKKFGAPPSVGSTTPARSAFACQR